jgi:hypothetical protein
MGDWAAAGGSGGGWLVVADHLIFIRLLIFERQILVVPQKNLMACNFWICYSVHIFSLKITPTCFTWKTSRCNFGGQNNHPAILTST